eukprot:TRINITY_DN513_c0_g1_i1.p1 TRINITY_DN513_c0_g1~~TRINITY_DN513_c0_g1_i1.p1  ORF type:complete len:228 (+),score=53.22 TRINITY_DN513_c0_g1_i1:72-755(+)
MMMMMMKGKGKGKSPAKKVDNALKVWVGGLPPNVDFKRLQAHFNQAGKTTWAEGNTTGNGSVCFTSVDEVNNAVMMLNGTVFEGSVIQVDRWMKSSTPGHPNFGKGKGKFGGGIPTWKPMFQKSWGAPSFAMKGKGKGKSPAKKVDNALKVWVGGLPPHVDFKKLQAHFNQAGKTTWAEGNKSGNGSVCFSSLEEVNTAVMMLNGTVFEGSIIQVDHWMKKSQQGLF